VSDGERLDRVFSFLRTLDALKTVERSAWLTGAERHEDDADHSWHMAVFALLLHRELGVEADLGRCLEMILCHDLIEALVGDTNVYDSAGREEQAAREQAAAEELYAQLPDDLREHVEGLWREFDAAETPEARFCKAMDRLQAMSQNVFTGGRGWRDHDVPEARVREVNGAVADRCPAVWPAFDWVFTVATAKGLWPR